MGEISYELYMANERLLRRRAAVAAGRPAAEAIWQIAVRGEVANCKIPVEPEEAICQISAQEDKEEPPWNTAVAAESIWQIAMRKKEATGKIPVQGGDSAR